MTTMSDLAPTLNILKTLVGFDTTSRNSNLALIDWVESYLDGHGVPHRRVPNADGKIGRASCRERVSCCV